jgi:hypothetical protein
MKINASPNEQLLDLTQKMFECATAGDWDQLSALEKSRLPLFKQIFTGGVSGNVELAREVLELDEKTKKLAEAQMPILQEEILKMQNSGKANNAYQAIQDSAPGSD